VYPEYTVRLSDLNFYLVCRVTMVSYTNYLQSNLTQDVVTYPEILGTVTLTNPVYVSTQIIAT